MKRYRNQSRQYYLSGPNRKIAQTVSDLLSPEKTGRLLDVGAGNGYLSTKLATAGFSVTACDLNPTQFEARHITVKKTNLNDKLPYPVGSFDCATCIEVIEHLENPWHIIRELHRVLKKKGILILSLPNFSNLISRFVFLARGNFRYFDDWTWQHWGHINPITYGELDRILNTVGFTTQTVTSQQAIPQPLAGALWLAQKTIAAVFRLYKTVRWSKDPQDTNLDLIASQVLMRGENIILKCQKR